MFQIKTHDTFSSAMFLAQRDDLLNVDRALLRGCGVRQRRFFSNGREGLEFLRRLAEQKKVPGQESLKAGIIVCDMDLADMSGLEFLRELRTLSRFEEVPVLLLASALPSSAVGTLGRMRRTAILCRPYTQADLVATLEFLSVEKNNGPMVTASPLAVHASERVRRPAPVVKKDALTLGLNFLHEGAFESAQAAFKDALRVKPQRAAAFRGLALAMNGLGDISRAYRLMRAAARFFIMDEDFFNARRALVQSGVMAETLELPPETASKNAGNPLYRAGCTLIGEGRYEPAARAILNGMAYTPNISPVNAVKRACAATENEYHTAECFCSQMEACGGINAAAVLRRVLTPPLLDEKPSKIGFLSDMFTMARQTYKMYRAKAV